MKYEEEEIKDQTTVLVILNVIIAIILGIAILLIWCVDHVYAQPQYRMSDLSNEWGSWTNISIGDTASGSTNITTNWGSYIQIKDTTTMEANKTYNLNISMKIEIQALGDRELFSSIVPYIYNGSTLTEQSLCTISGTKSDSNTSGILAKTTHIYNASINCVGLKGTGYYPYFTIRFRADSNTLISPMKLIVNGYNFQVGSDSTDSINIMNNQNQNTQSIIDADNQNTESIINNQNENTTQVIEALENQNKVCNNNIIYRSDSSNALELDKYLNSNGGTINATTSYISDYYRTDGDVTTIININGSSIPNAPNFCFYDKDKTVISCEAIGRRKEITVTNPTNAYYIRTSGYMYDGWYQVITTSYCYDYREKETEQLDEFLNYDHDFGNQIDTSYANTTHQNEETMTANLDGNLTNVNINIDSDANGLIWYIIEHTVHANTVVFVMTITILSLGIVKLVLGR